MNTNVLSSVTRRCSQFIAALATITLVACGGGGGSGNTVIDKAGLPLSTSANSQVSLAAGASAEYSVSGGGGGSKFVSYTASSSDSKVAQVSLQGTKFTITAVAPGTATVNVADSASANVAITVSVTGDSLAKVSVNAPAAVTLDPGMSAQYKVAGGVAPYSVVSSNPHVLAAATGNGSVSITAANAGTATVVLYDAIGMSAKFDVTVTGGGLPVALYTTAPETIRMSLNTSLDFVIKGGVAPYTVSASDAAVVTATINGTDLNIKAVGEGKAVLNIRDSAGTLLVSTVTANGSSPVSMYTTAPSSISIGLGAAPTYTIQGGIPAFIASTSNANVATVAITNGNEINITGISAGIANLTVFDSTGSAVKIAVTVAGGTGNVPLYSTAPDSITVIVGAAPSYTIAGGAGPYVVASSDVTVVTVSQTGSTFTINGVKAGTAVVSIHDANGTPLAITVTVP